MTTVDDHFAKLPPWERVQADALAQHLLGCARYTGSTDDARIDALGIARAGRFAPPLGDNHHNARLCPYCTPAGDILIRNDETTRVRMAAVILDTDEPGTQRSWALAIAAAILDDLAGKS